MKPATGVVLLVLSLGAGETRRERHHKSDVVAVLVDLSPRHAGTFIAVAW